MMIPTNPIKPLTATAAAVPAGATTTRPKRARRTSISRPPASPSPRPTTTRTRRTPTVVAERRGCGRPSPARAARGHARQMRTGQGRGEPPAVRGTCARQHPAYQCGEHDSRSPDLPEDGVIHGAQRRRDVENLEVRKQLSDYR